MEQLPPGFRFYPTEEELISFYLHNKLHSLKPEVDRIIPSIDIYKFEPSQLPEQASQLCHKDMEQWFFFTPQQEREARGGRPNRTTDTGYWKATGSPNYVYSANNKVIGVKKTMVFYEGRAPNGRKTKWKMNEYKEAIKQENDHFDTSSTIPKLRHELSLCRVYVTSGCARAFDRRPSGTAPTNTNLHHEIGQGSGTQNDNNAPTSMLEEISSSIDDSSNSRGDNNHGTTHQGGGVTMEGNNNNNSYDTEMTESLDSLLDWEQIDWL